ncbi:aromatic acid exporter family protein [Streptomyces sp. CC219B]|uniref:FUSC family protein n=1 Tax=Streptomyces sp. CC219B TaxID=3044574 RepID=UPI0024A7A4FB|nr:aromatic acid exporter family protein [Streptomyces sp. CC219B]
MCGIAVVRDEVVAVGGAVRRVWAGPGRERDLVLQAFKSALAAVVAWVVADQVLRAPMAFIAPWVAVVLVRSTVYRSLAQAIQQMGAIALGTVVATACGMALGVPALAMAVVLPLVLLVGNWPRLGDQGVYGATAALFVLTAGEPDLDAAVARVLESLLGAAVGVGVNMLVFPPVHLRDAEATVRQVVEEAGRTLRAIADGLEDSWDRHQARNWQQQARRLFRLIDQARAALEHGTESARWNPDRRRRDHLRRIREPYRHVVSVLEQLTDYVADLARTFAEVADDDFAPPRPGSDTLASYARFLREIAAAVDAYGQAVTGDDPAAARACLDRRVHGVRLAHDRLRQALLDTDGGDAEWVALNGALLTDARRLADQLLPEPPQPHGPQEPAR